MIETGIMLAAIVYLALVLLAPRLLVRRGVPVPVTARVPDQN